MMMTRIRKRLTPTGWMAALGMMIFLGLGLVEVLTAQEPGPGPTAAEILNSGETLWNSGNYDSARQVFLLARKKAEAENDLPTLARAMTQTGIALSQNSQYKQAISVLDSVVAMAGTIDSLDRGIFFARKELGNIALRQGNLEQAIGIHRKLAADVESAKPAADSLIGMANDALAQTVAYSGDLESAMNYSDKARQHYLHWGTGGHQALAYCENTLAILNMYLSRYDSAISHFRESLDLLKESLPDDHPNVLQIRANLGVMYGEQGLFLEALDIHRKNLPYLDRLPPAAHLNGLLNMASTLLVTEDYDESLRYFDMAELYLQKYPDLTTQSLPYIFNQKSVAYEEMGNTDKATELIQASIRANENLYGPSSPDLVVDYLQYGSLLQTTGKADSAAYFFMKALALNSEIAGPQSLRSGHANQFLGELALEEGNFTEALNWFQQAEDIMRAIGNVSSQVDAILGKAAVMREQGNLAAAMDLHEDAWEQLLPEVPFALQPDERVLAKWETLFLKELLREQGKTLQEMGSTSQSPDQLTAALSCFETAIQVMDSVRMFALASESGGILIRNNRDLYELAIGTALQLHRQTSDPGYLHQAFALADRSRANLLRDHLRNLDALHMAGIPDSLLEQEQYLRQRTSVLREALARESGASRDSIGSLLLDLKGRYKTMISTIENEYPDYFLLKYRYQSFSSKDVADFTDRDQALFSYFWGQEKLYVFSLFREKWSAVEVPLEAQPDKNEPGKLQGLDDWLAFISRPPGEKQVIPDAILQDFLLPNLPESADRLIIIPDGNLCYLPFESLLMSSPGNATPYREWPYLGKTHSIVYSPSVDLLIKSQANDDDYAGYVGLAPSFREGGTSGIRGPLSPLINNEREVMEVAELLQGKAFTGPEATKGVLQSNSDEFQVYHFATHAVAEKGAGGQGMLFLASDTTGEQPHSITTGEIYGLTLHSPLVVLSACETGSGPIQAGEGVLSLARAFQYSGADRVLASLWNTNDEAGYQIMVRFFEELRKGQKPDQSLEISRLSWLESAPDFQCHPYYWSGFVLIGPDADFLLSVNRGLPWWEVFIGSFVALFLFMWWWSKKNLTKKQNDFGQ